jgi:hypothetical protein
MAPLRLTFSQQFFVAVPGPDRDGVARWFFLGFQNFPLDAEVVTSGPAADQMGSPPNRQANALHGDGAAPAGAFDRIR